jgi:glycosyltransferase involved in cell wall biosynthesis
MPNKLAIIASHPIQYQAPWFDHIATNTHLEFKVYYLSGSSKLSYFDSDFNQEILWDIPLLNGYNYEFTNIKNLKECLSEYNPNFILNLGYKFENKFLHNYMNTFSNAKLLLRGDSHLLAPENCIKSIVKKVVLTSIFKKYACFLYTGEANYQYFKNFGVRDEQLFFAPHALPKELYSSLDRNIARDIRIELGIPKDDLVFLYSGKLIEKKSPELLLKAFAEITNDRTHLIVIGSGPLEQELKSKFNSYKNIYWAGFQNQMSLYSYYQAIDLLILPSKGLYETWGLVVQEAALNGKPSLVSSVVGAGLDLVDSDFIFQSESLTDLASKLKYIISNSNMLKAAGETARQKALKYSYETASTGLINALEYLTSGNN